MRHSRKDSEESGLQWWHEYDRDVQQEPTFLLAPVGGTGGWTSPARRQAVFEIIDGLLEEFPIDRQRIYLMGFSLGGAGIWNYLQQRPGFFAAANPQAPAGGIGGSGSGQEYADLGHHRH